MGVHSVQEWMRVGPSGHGAEKKRGSSCIAEWESSMLVTSLKSRDVAFVT